MAGYTLLQEEAYTHIKEQILSGALREEQIYSETKIAAMIGISRTPVKDALVRLSQERLVDILPSRGFRLHRMSEADVYKRQVLEVMPPLAIRKAGVTFSRATRLWTPWLIFTLRTRALSLVSFSTVRRRRLV